MPPRHRWARQRCTPALLAPMTTISVHEAHTCAHPGAGERRTHVLLTCESWHGDSLVPSAGIPSSESMLLGLVPTPRHWLSSYVSQYMSFKNSRKLLALIQV